MEHTTGKLVLRIDGRPELNNQNEILETEDGQRTVVYFRFKNREDASRLVACWNACDGVPLDEVENLANIGGLNALTVEAGQAYADADALKAQRDELLIALEALADCLPAEGSRAHAPYFAKAELDAARALIAKHKGGAARATEGSV